MLNSWNWAQTHTTSKFLLKHSCLLILPETDVIMIFPNHHWCDSGSQGMHTNWGSQISHVGNEHNLHCK